MIIRRACLAAIGILLSSGTTRAAEIIFLCTDALAPAVRELAPAFEKTSGHVVKTTVANAGTIAARLEDGEVVDLAIVLPSAWQRLNDLRRIDPNVRVVIGKVGLGAFVRKGAAKPEFGGIEAFKRALLTAGTLAVRDPAQRSPVGIYMLALFDRLALSESFKPKIILTPLPPYEEVTSGKADIGFSTLAEIASHPEVESIGPLPPELQTYNVFVTAIPIRAGERAIVEQFVRFLSSGSSKALLRAKGIEVD